MTRKEIIKLAREAGLGTALTHGGENRVWIEGADWHDELVRFAALVAAHEREQCAKVCDGFQARDVGMQPAECAGAIRERRDNT